MMTSRPEPDPLEGARTENRIVRGIKPVKKPGKDIRPDYQLTLMASLAGSLLLMTVLMRAPVRGDDGAFDITLAEQETVQMEEIVQTKQIERPPPPPRPPVPVEVPDDVVLDDEDLQLDASLDMDAPLLDLPPPPPTPVAQEEEEEEIEIFVVVEQMPEIVGGSQKVYEYLEYPTIARQAGMEGLVVVQIIVEPNGRPAEPVVARSAGQALDEAAVSAVMKLQFVPGKQRGKAVRVRMSIPIRFRLRDAK